MRPIDRGCELVIDDFVIEPLPLDRTRAEKEHPELIFIIQIPYHVWHYLLLSDEFMVNS